MVVVSFAIALLVILGPAPGHGAAHAARVAAPAQPAPPRLVPGITPDGPVARGVHRFPSAVIPPGVPPGTVDTLHFFSPALHRQDKALVYLPPGYARAAAQGRRYPVLYLLHGSPGLATSIFDGGWAGRDASVLIAAHRIQPMIIVAPYGRYGLRNNTEWANGRHGRYLSYVGDVVHAVDGTAATIPDRAHRVIAGDSEGAYGAANVALHDLSLFGGFQSWSGYFTETPTGTFAGAGAATIAANSPRAYVTSLGPQIRSLGLHAFVYAGAQDPSSLKEMPAFVAALRGAGGNVGSAVYPGRHNWTLWRAQMPHMLELVSSWLAAGPKGA
jgi:enterochelin esterase-like enzyme